MSANEIGTQTSDCCSACAKAVEITKQPGTTPFNSPFVGRPLGKVRLDDTVRSFGGGPHVLGMVGWYRGELTVRWEDRTYWEPLKGAIVMCVLRTEELPSVSGAGLMPINGELVEMAS